MYRMISAPAQAAAEYFGMASQGFEGGFNSALHWARHFASDHFFAILGVLAIIVVLASLSGPRVR